VKPVRCGSSSCTAAVLVGAGAAALLVPGSSAAPAAGGSPAACPSRSGAEIVQRVRLPGRPGFLLLRGRTLWVAIAADRPGGRGRLARLDARTGRVERVFRLPGNPYQIAYGFGSLWVTGEVRAASRRFAGVLRLDPRTGRLLRVIRGRLLGSKLAATPDGIWVGGADVYPPGRPFEAGVRYVFRIDPHRNAVARTVKLPGTTVIDLLAEGRAVWATGWGGVVKLSRTGRVLYRQPFYGSGWAMARTAGAVWVAQPFSGTRDPRTQRQARRLLKVSLREHRVAVVELEDPPGDVSTAGGVVWLGTRTLARIAAGETPPAPRPLGLDVRPNRIAAFRGGAWIDELGATTLTKIC
jgi:hypothetical protein